MVTGYGGFVPLTVGEVVLMDIVQFCSVFLPARFNCIGLLHLEILDGGVVVGLEFVNMTVK
jgi:hypothetical protein